jgi:Ketopantoate reductase
MKVLVYGTGVIGTTYGFVLAQAGHDVTHYVRPGEGAAHPADIRIRLLDGRTAEPRELDAVYPAKIVDGFGPNDGYELILVSLKHYDVPHILYQLAVDAGKADILFFNNWWDDLAPIDAVLKGRYLWGFPVAGGGWSDGVLDAALLDSVHLGEIDGSATERLARIRGLFESAGLTVEVDTDILNWLWVHFATEAGLISSAIAAGSIDALLDDTRILEEAVLAGREALEVCRARGVPVEQIPDAQTLYGPAAAVAVGIHDFYATNVPARKILGRHTGVEELKRIYGDVVATGRQLGVAMPRLSELGPAVEAWQGATSGSTAATIREPIAVGAAVQR